MNKSWFYLGVISSLSILITSCGGDSKPPTPAATPPAAKAPAAAAPPTVPPKPVATAPTKPVVPPTAAVKTPAVPAKSVAIKPVSVDVAAGLIAPTDGESWAKTVLKGRADPFGMLSLQPIEIIEPIDPRTQVVAPKQLSPKPASPQAATKIASNNLPAPSKSVVNKLSPLPTVKVAANSTKIANPAKNQKIASNAVISPKTKISKDRPVTISDIPRSGINRDLPKVIVALPTAKAIQAPTIPKSRKNISLAVKPVPAKTIAKAKVMAVPAPTQIAAKPEKVAEKPLQAMAIEISGVIEVGGQTQVIIKLPTESFSRYIEVGEKIGNGKVLVKRVEGQNSLSPTVVLEEVGVEVPRKVGDRTSEPAVPTTPPPQKTI
jgi:hypothetical protein